MLTALVRPKATTGVTRYNRRDRVALPVSRCMSRARAPVIPPHAPGCGGILILATRVVSRNDDRSGNGAGTPASQADDCEEIDRAAETGGPDQSLRNPAGKSVRRMGAEKPVQPDVKHAKSADRNASGFA